jgi:sec-independent protein translocase protein TatB
MFDIGFWELIILFGLGLLVLGPERLPRVAMQIGNWAGQARRMARTLTAQIRNELDIDINRPFSPQPERPTYSRPDMDDLKPGQPEDHEDQQPETDDDPAHVPQDDPAPDSPDTQQENPVPDSPEPAQQDDPVPDSPTPAYADQKQQTRP